MTFKINRENVSVFFSRIGQADEQACRKVLSPDELEKAMAFKFEKDRQLSILARAQIRYLISEITGTPAKTLSFSRDDRGKPGCGRNGWAGGLIQHFPYPGNGDLRFGNRPGPGH